MELFWTIAHAQCTLIFVVCSFCLLGQGILINLKIFLHKKMVGQQKSLICLPLFFTLKMFFAKKYCFYRLHYCFYTINAWAFPSTIFFPFEIGGSFENELFKSWNNTFFHSFYFYAIRKSSDKFVVEYINTVKTTFYVNFDFYQAF